MRRRRHHVVGLCHEVREVGHIGREGIGLLSHGGQASAGLKEERRDEVGARLCAQLSGRGCEYGECQI